MADQNLTAQVARLADRVEGFARKLDSVSAAPAAPPPWKTVSFWIPVVLAVIGLAGIDRSLGLLNTRISDLAAVVSSLDQRLTPAVEKLNERNAELDKRLALDEASKAPRP